MNMLIRVATQGREEGYIPDPAVVWMKGRPMESLRQKENQLLLPQTTTRWNTLLLAFALGAWESTDTSRGSPDAN
jgi:hypothetical protein